MHSLYIIYILTILFAGGASIDGLVLKRQKKHLYAKAVKSLNVLKQTPVPNLLRITAKWLVKFEPKITTNPVKSIIFYLLSSFAFVSVAVLFAAYLSGDDWTKGLSGDFFDRTPLPHVAIVGTVIIFDIITLVLMRKFLVNLQIKSGVSLLAGIICHVFFLIVLMIFCFGSMRYVENVLVNHAVIGERAAQKYYSMNSAKLFFEDAKTNAVTYSELKSYLAGFNEYISKMQMYRIRRFNYFTTDPKIFVNSGDAYKWVGITTHFNNTYRNEIYQSINDFFLKMEGYNVYWKDDQTTTIYYLGGTLLVTQYNLTPASINEYFLTGTLAIPALILVIAFLFMFVAKVVSSIIRFFLMQYFELITEKEPNAIMPFTILAAAADIVILLIKCFCEFISWMYSL